MFSEWEMTKVFCKTAMFLPAKYSLLTDKGGGRMLMWRMLMWRRKMWRKMHGSGGDVMRKEDTQRDETGKTSLGC